MKRKLGIAVAGLVLAAVGRADTLGSNPSAGLPTLDTCSGCSFVYIDFAAAEAGQTVSSFSFFAGAGTASHEITPLLFENTGGDNFEVVGIGETRSGITADAENTFAFGLQSGTATVAGANTWFGWVDGGPKGGSNSGTITLSTTGGIGQFYAAEQSMSLDGSIDYSTFTGVGQQDRTYSLDVTTSSVQPVPEPSTAVLLSTLLAIAFVARLRIAR
jgi:hypothetical protein